MLACGHEAQPTTAIITPEEGEGDRRSRKGVRLVLPNPRSPFLIRNKSLMFNIPKPMRLAAAVRDVV